MAKKIEIEWGGETFSIPEDRWFEAAEEVEEVLTILDIEATRFAARPKLAKLARGYAVMINFAGGEVTPDEVYGAIKKQLTDVKNKSEAKIKKIIVTRALVDLNSLLLGITPEADDTKAAPLAGADGDGEKKASRKRARRS